MNTEYSYSGYTASGPSNGSVGYDLAEKFVDLTCRLKGVLKWIRISRQWFKLFAVKENEKI